MQLFKVGIYSRDLVITVITVESFLTDCSRGWHQLMNRSDFRGFLPWRDSFRLCCNNKKTFSLLHKMIQAIERSWQKSFRREDLKLCVLGEPAGSFSWCEEVFTVCPYILRVIIEGRLQLLVGQMRDGGDLLSSFIGGARKALLTRHFCPALIVCASCDQI